MRSVKALFLDVDGVLNSRAWTDRNTGDLCDVDPEAVARVRKLCQLTGAEIVLTSTWRLIPFLTEQLHDSGLPVEYGSTPRLDAFGTRSDEIRAYLAEHPEIESFAIVDDDADAGYGNLAPHFVKTNEQVGLTNADCILLAARLGTAPALQAQVA
jgi:hypothetical protein